MPGRERDGWKGRWNLTGGGTGWSDKEGELQPGSGGAASGRMDTGVPLSTLPLTRRVLRITGIMGPPRDVHVNLGSGGAQWETSASSHSDSVQSVFLVGLG